MLGKLIKYDMRSQRRILVPLTLAIIAASLLCTVALRFLISMPEDDLMTMMFTASTGVFIFLNVVVILAYPTATVIFTVVHFYRNLYTDEGYLTFTLPVKTKSILASKFITAIIWALLSIVVSVLCGVVVLLFGTATDSIYNPEILGILGEIFAGIFEFMGWSSVLYVVYAVLWLLYLIVTLFLSVTIGSIAAKKHKVLASIGIYYLINLVTSIVTNIINAIIMFAALANGGESDLIYTVLWSPMVDGILYLGFAAAAYITCRHMMSNSLNLP